MIRKLAFALIASFAASMIVQVIAVGQAVAAPKCHYTSQDKAKGYKC
jgi:hypothetical protein